MKMPSFWENLKVDGQDMRMYTSVPRGSGPFPAIVVAQHGGGVDTFIQSICDRLAGDGYAAVAPDLFHRITPEMLADGSRPFNHLSDPDIIADVNAAVDFLRNHRAIDGERLGITGSHQPALQGGSPLLWWQHYGALGQGYQESLRADQWH
jgi:carboxymethylenebutenolidase